MKKNLILLAVAVSLFTSGLICGLDAAEIKAGRSGTGHITAAKVATDDNTTKAVEVPGANQQKAAEESRKNAEEAKKIVIARVNGAEINMFMLTRAMNRIAPKYAKENDATSAETTERIKKEALDRLIFEELAVQEAIRQGINPTSGAIDKVINQVKENLGSEQAYKEYLDKNDLTEDVLKELIARSQRIELITAKEVYGKVKVDEKLLHDEYEKEKGKYILPENFVADDVWFVKGNDEAARKKAVEILEVIRKSQNEPLNLLLDGTFIVRQLTVKKEKYPELYKSMTGMKVGDLSGVIDEKDGFHIIKVVKKEHSRSATFEEARRSLATKFLYPAQEERRQQWQDGLRDNAKIEIFPDEK